MGPSGEKPERDEESAVPAFEAGLHAGDSTFRQSDAALLRAIDETGSLNAATERLDHSYPRTLQRIDELEEAFGTLVNARRGGVGGGGTDLTDRAHQLISQFERLHTELASVAEVGETVYDGCVVDRDGELATVWTLAGQLRALATTDARKVQVTIRADTVTLQDPATAPDDTETTARNRFEGHVIDVEESKSIVRVAVDIGGPQPLLALVTPESCADLDVRPGAPIVVSFKTVATRATGR